MTQITTLDITQVKRAIAVFETFTDVAHDLTKQIDRLTRANDDLAKSAKATADKAEQLIAKLNRGSDAMARATAAAQANTTAATRLAEATQNAADASRNALKSDTAKVYRDQAEAAKTHANALEGVGKKAKFTAGDLGKLVEVFNKSMKGAADGMSPLAIAADQLPALIPIFANLTGASAGFAVAGGAAAAVVGGSLVVATATLNEKHKDFASTLGLTAAQLEHVKDKGITMGDVLTGTLKTASDALGSAFGPALVDVQKGLADFGGFAFKVVRDVVGFFGGAIEAARSIWGQLPAILGNLTIRTAQFILDGVNKLINGSIDLINGLIVKTNGLAAKLGLELQIPTIDHVAFAKLKNEYAEAGADVSAAYARGYANAVAPIDRGAKTVEGNILDETKKRIIKEAKAGEEAKAAAAKQVALAGKAEPKTVCDCPPQMQFAEPALPTPELKAAEFGSRAAADAAPADPMKTEAVRTYLDLLKEVDAQAQDVSTKMADGFGKVGQAIGAMLTSMTSYAVKQQEIEEQRKAITGQTLEDRTKLQALDQQSAELSIKTFGAQISAAKGFFKEGTAGYKALQIAENAYRAYEIAMAVKSMATKLAAIGTVTTAAVAGNAAEATSAVAADTVKTTSTLAGTAIRTPLKIAEGAATMFQTLGPLGFAAVAAMAAVMSGFGVSSGGARTNADAKDRQASQGTGTVLGDPSAKSESLTRALDLAAANSNTDLEYTNQMLQALRSIDNRMGVLAAALTRTLSAGGALDTAKLGLGKTVAARGLFGATTTKTLQDQGLEFTAQSVGDILHSGINGSTYQQVGVETKKKFLGLTYSDKTSTSTTSSALEADLAAQLSALVGSLKTGVMAAATALGVDGASALLDAFQVNLGKISLKDLSGKEIEEQLNAVFSKLGDQMAGALLPGLSAFQKVGEGGFETLTRLAREYQVVDTSLASIGKTFGSVGLASIAARDTLVELAGGLDDFTSKVSFFATNFLTEAERLAPVQTAVAQEFARLGISGVVTKEQFKQLVLGLDTSTRAGAELFSALLNVAPAFLKVADAAQNSKQDRLDKAQAAVDQAKANLKDAYDAESSALQSTIDKFKAFARTLGDFRRQLSAGSLAQLSPAQQYAASKETFEQVARLAAQGNEQALNQLVSAGQDYLEASKGFQPDLLSYQRDLALVRTAVERSETYANTAVNTATQQLGALNQMVGGLITINQSVMSVQTAIQALQLAQAQQAAAQAQVNTPAPPPVAPPTPTAPTSPTPVAPRPANDWGSYLTHYPDVAAEYMRLFRSSKGPKFLANDLGVHSAEQFAAWHYARYGAAEGRTPYALGGVIDRPMTVGEAGLAGEAGPEALMPLVRGPRGLSVRSVSNDNSAAEEIRTLRLELKSALLAIAQNTGETARTNRRWNNDGLPATRVIS